MKTILVAIDLSQKDEKLIQRANQSALNTNAKVHILHVRRTLRALGIDHTERQRHDTLMAKINNLIRDNFLHESIMQKVHIAEGPHVYEQIDHYAKTLGADLVIMGASDPSDETPNFVQTTLEKLLLKASYPILVCSAHTKNSYENVALNISLKSDLIQAIGVLAPMVKNNDITLHYFSEDYAADKETFFARQISKIKKRKEDKFKSKINDLFQINSLFKSDLYFIKHNRNSAHSICEDVQNIKADILVSESLKQELNATKPNTAAREILNNLPCDHLLIERT